MDSLALEPAAASFLPRSFPAAGVATLVIVAACGAASLALARTRWRQAAAWTALALGGQACALQLLCVGPLIRPQLFWGWRELLTTYRIIFFALLGASAIVAFVGAALHWRRVRQTVSRVIPASAFLVVLAAQLFTAIDLAPADVRAFAGGAHLRIATLQLLKSGQGLVIFLAGTFALWLAAAALPEEAWQSWRERWERRNRRAIALAAALWVVVVSSLLAWLVFERVPHLHDEVAYVFQAKYLATGKLYLPPPPEPKAFESEFGLLEGNKWYVATTVGWPAVLALGYVVGLPWLVNPLLGGAAILLAHALTRRVYDSEVADGTVLLLAGSPWLLFLSASLMPHPVTLTVSLLALYGVARAREEGSILWGCVAGLATGGVLQVRPLDAVILATVAGVWWLSAGLRKLRLAPLAAAVVAGLAMAWLFLAYNHAITGNSFYPPIRKFTDTHYYPGADRLGFGKDVGNFGWTELDPLPGHGARDVFVNTNINGYLLNFELFGWPCGSLLFVFLLFAWRRFREDALMWGLLVAVWAGFSCYWFSGGPDFGPRYWYLMILPCAVLTIRGAQSFAARAESGAAELSGGPASSRVWAFVALASVIGTFNLVTWRSLDKYYHYRGMRADVRRMAPQFGRSLVFVRGDVFPDYAAAFAQNPPDLSHEWQGTIFVHDLGPESRTRLEAYYADRTVWVLAGPTETGDGFKIIEGPAAPGGAPH